MMGTRYAQDIVKWSQEQAQLLRSGQLSALDIEHIAEEIEDVGKSEKRELASRLAVLLAHLLKWQFQPSLRGKSWSATIKTQRNGIARALNETPSLKSVIADMDWFAGVWDDAVAEALKETRLEIDMPESCPWTFSQIMDANWKPE